MASESAERSLLCRCCSAASWLVATGRTLRENGLVEREAIFESTARLIANRVSHKMRAAELDDLVRRMEQVVA